MPLSGMKDQVRKACELPQNSQAQGEYRKKRKARLRLARRVALITACLLIGICVYSVLDPIPVSTASSFASRVKIWIGNVLQLDVAVDAPPPPDFQGGVEEASVEHYDCKTIEDVYAAFGFTVYEPGQMKSVVKLGSVEADLVNGGLASFRYRYVEDEKFVVLFTIQPLGTEPPIVSLPDDAFLHAAPAGEFNIFEAASGGWHAVAVTGESIISIHGKMDRDAFLGMLDTLRVIH